MNRSTAARIRAAEDGIRAAGWGLRYVQFVEDGDTPGIWPGLYAGATDPGKREVKIRHEVRSVVLAEVLEHELHHVRDFDAGIPAGKHSWCGNHFSLDGLTIGSQVKDPGRAR